MFRGPWNRDLFVALFLKTDCLGGKLVSGLAGASSCSTEPVRYTDLMVAQAKTSTFADRLLNI